MYFTFPPYFLLVLNGSYGVFVQFTFIFNSHMMTLTFFLLVDDVEKLTHWEYCHTLATRSFSHNGINGKMIKCLPAKILEKSDSIHFSFWSCNLFQWHRRAGGWHSQKLRKKDEFPFIMIIKGRSHIDLACGLFFLTYSMIDTNKLNDLTFDRASIHFIYEHYFMLLFWFENDEKRSDKRFAVLEILLLFFSSLKLFN